MSKGKGQLVIANRTKAAQAGMKGMTASTNPPMPKALGSTPGAPAKTGPQSPAKSAIAPKVEGTKTKNPAENMGGSRKLGNHF